jgi:hypothetical protein
MGQVSVVGEKSGPMGPYMLLRHLDSTFILGSE